MNIHAGMTEMSDLLHIRGMVKMGMGEHDGIYLIPVGFNCRREHSGINENVSDQISVPEKIPSRNPCDWHAY